MTPVKEQKMTKAEVAAALRQKTQAADHASNFLASMIAQFNYANDIAIRRMAEMTNATRHGRGRDEQDRS